MMDISTVCVYCSASPRVDAYYHDQAFALGTLLGQAGIHLVYGGGRLGLMGRVADGVLGAGSQVVGFMPEHLQEMEQGHPSLTELHIVHDMHTRKRCMFERADAFVVMPGGFGTLDEVFEVITWKQIGLHDKPIILVNLRDYWTPLRDLVNNVVDQSFAKPEHRNYFHFVNSIEDVLPLLETLPEERFAPNSEII